MLISLDELLGYRLDAIDGTLGKVKDILFDDRSWIIRYFVVDTSNWLPGRKVLIYPGEFGRPQPGMNVIPVMLTTEEIEESPPLAEDMPVSKQKENELHSHYNWVPVFGGFHGTVPPPVPMTLPPEKESHDADVHLRSVKEVLGYSVTASHEKVGQVSDFIASTKSWHIHYVAGDVEVGQADGRRLVAPQWIDSVDWETKSIEIELSAAQFVESPRYDPAMPVNREYETRLYDFHGRPRYWESIAVGKNKRDEDLPVTARECMTPSLPAIPANSLVTAAAMRMKNFETQFLAVIKERKIAGAITARDIVVRVIGEGKDPKRTRVDEVMSTPIHSCKANESIQMVTENMAEAKVNQLVVLDEESYPIGVISINDIALMAGQPVLVGEALCRICKDE